MCFSIKDNWNHSMNNHLINRVSGKFVPGFLCLNCMYAIKVHWKISKIGENTNKNSTLTSSILVLQSYDNVTLCKLYIMNSCENAHSHETKINDWWITFETMYVYRINCYHANGNTITYSWKVSWPSPRGRLALALVVQVWVSH